MTAPIKHRTLSSALVDHIRQAILDGSYPAGAQLRQDALASQHQVSRIPVREALFQLEAEGFVRIVAHKGAVVSGISLEEINDVFALRGLLEPRLLADAGPRMSAADIEVMTAMEEEFEKAIASGDAARWGELNAAFHLALYARTTLPRTLAIVAGLLQTSERYTRLQLSKASSLTRARDEHGELVRLCEAGKLAEAGVLLSAHIETVRAELVMVLSAAGLCEPPAA
jgi:DNA-binding GntR family transcriptional regulator